MRFLIALIVLVCSVAALSAQPQPIAKDKWRVDVHVRPYHPYHRPYRPPYYRPCPYHSPYYPNPYCPYCNPYRRPYDRNYGPHYDRPTW